MKEIVINENDKKLLKFIKGEINVLQYPFILSREKAPNGSSYFVLSSDFGEKALLMLDFWKNASKSSDYICSINEETGEIDKTEKKPKHTGGKKPYIMLMIEEIEKLKKKNVKSVEEMIGYLVCLGNYIEWSTGRLIKKRKKEPLQYKDLLNIYGCSNNKLNMMLGKMKEHDLLYSTQEGYFISTRFIKKGKTKKR